MQRIMAMFAISYCVDSGCIKKDKLLKLLFNWVTIIDSIKTEVAPTQSVWFYFDESEAIAHCIIISIVGTN